MELQRQTLNSTKQKLTFSYQFTIQLGVTNLLNIQATYLHIIYISTEI